MISSRVEDRERQGKVADRKRGRPKIAFFGSFGRKNFGNEATLQAMLWNLQRLVPEAEFTCLCTGPEGVAADYKIAAVPIRDYVVKPWKARNPLARWARKILVGAPSEFWRWVQGVKMLRGTAALIVPGTGLLTDAYTLVNWGPYDMFRWSVVAKLARCKLLFVSVGAGPFYSRPGRFFVKTALSLADFRSYREEPSRDWLKRIGFQTAHDPMYPDLAFSLPPAVLGRGRERKSRRPIVGVGLMEFAGKLTAEKPVSAVHAAYLETLAEFVKWLLAHGYDVRLLVGDFTDEAVRREFKSLLAKRGLTQDEGRIIDEPIESVEELLSQIAETDLVVATRFHNILLSLFLNKPTIAISFHHKCSSLMSQMGLADYCEEMGTLKLDGLIEQFRRLEKNAPGLQATLAAKVEEFRDALDEQYRSILQAIWPDGERLWATETDEATSRVES
ncbi:MAG: polysaccharide pyruvyl transferase family protein [Acidobacteriota bacterium]|nr:polysaccharide pyruvyl transferase family protein [Acidobacteriota bacterium]